MSRASENSEWLPGIRAHGDHKWKKEGEWLDSESNRGHEDFQSSALPTELSGLNHLPPALNPEV